MSLARFEHKKVKLITVKDEVFIGVITDYSYPEDNVPEEEGIITRDDINKTSILFLKNEIKSITII